MSKTQEKNMTPEQSPEEKLEVSQEAQQEELEKEKTVEEVAAEINIPLERYFGSKLIMAAQMTENTFKSTIKGQFVDMEAETREGYFVLYEDGYKSWSPKEAFEKAYHRMDYLNFGQALDALKSGYKVARKGWNGKEIHIELQRPDENSKMTSPYIFVDTTGLVTDNVHAPKSRVPWMASQTDMLAEDWIVIL